MKKTLLLALTLTSALLFTACNKQSDQWVGFHYPEGMAGPVAAGCNINEFESKEKCETWGEEQSQGSEQSDYYCGYKCKYDDSCQYTCQTGLEKNFEVIETMTEECTLDSDCETPADYMMSSVCPYESKCIEEKCTVICPHPYKGRKIEIN